LLPASNLQSKQSARFSTTDSQSATEDASKGGSKWSNPGTEFDKAAFQKQFEDMRPPQNEHFDKSLKVFGLNDGQFLINHYWVNGSVIIFPDRFYMWNIVESEEIKPHTLEIMNFVKPRPDYLIIGTGETNLQLDTTFYEHFRRMGISVDTCPTFEACSTFNMCVEDEYNVACALLQPRFATDREGKDPMPAVHSDYEEQHISGMIGLGNEGFGKERIRERQRAELQELSKKFQK
jgi:uncharacterized protein